MDSNGSISPLGRQYVNATADQNLSSSAAKGGRPSMDTWMAVLVGQSALLVWMFGLC